MEYGRGQNFPFVCAGLGSEIPDHLRAEVLYAVKGNCMILLLYEPVFLSGLVWWIVCVGFLAFRESI